MPRSALALNASERTLLGKHLVYELQRAKNERRSPLLDFDANNATEADARNAVNAPPKTALALLGKRIGTLLGRPRDQVRAGWFL